MIKQLLSGLREYRKSAVLAPVYVTIESILEIIIPTLMAFLIDNGVNKGDMAYVMKIGLALAACAAFSLAAGILAGRSAAVASAGLAKNLRRDMFYNVQRFSFSNIDRFSTASVVTRLTTDVANVQNAFQVLIRMGVRSPVMMVFALIFSFNVNPRLSMVFLGAAPVLGIGLWFIISRVHPVFVRIFKTYDRLNNTVQENLRGIRVVKAYNREDFEVKRFEGVSKAIYEDFTRAEKRLAFNMPLMQFCLYACMLALSWFGAKEIIETGNDAVSGFSTGELTSMITYTMQILMSLMMLSMVFVMIIISRASAERIVELLNEESDLKNRENPVYDVADGAVTFQSVTFSYSGKAGKPVLNDINLRIESGETVGIIGGTGSAKSSLVQLIPRLYDVSAGSVTVGGIDVRRYDIETLRSAVAVVLQKNVLFSGTIKENLLWGNENASEEELERVCRLAQAEGFIRELPGQYDYYIEQGGTNVSGGQRQRLCIARALLKNPKILILDDSTSAVDTKTDALLRRAFREYIPEVTKIIIAQRAASVQDADKIIVMDDGRAAAVGTHAELMENCDIYREVYESQTGGGALNG